MRFLNYVRLALLILFVLSNPAACAESVRDSPVAQWQLALNIVCSMMDEYPDLRSDPTAHELLGDIYTEARLFEKARIEYEIAIFASCRN